ncbi:hypothetical protein G5714_014961 [Onychostoma macrolepis]|uniref:Uncharacterized protein n=1 Tax=Onychostoma macrolepis TaxID=369639 RepID=A0A7J6CA96_9TELE|nr:hypothetical protein G5714_014961 [Onychostoma macrolepis]
MMHHCLVPVQCEDIDKISVQCQNDEFGLDAEVVYDEKSFPLRWCTPFVTGSYHGGRVPGHNQETAAGQVWDSSAVNGQISANAGFSTNADVLGAESDSLTFTDGIVPGFIAPDSVGSNGHELMLNRDEHYEKAEGGQNTASPLKSTV